MDAMQFGKWISEQRRSRGWTSQRALAQAIQQEPALRASGISESFLARLEAGLLAHPFRGDVRRRVIALMEVLCTTPRDVTLFLRAAAIGELTTEERYHLKQVEQRLSQDRAFPPVLLPPRPQLLIGREAAVQEVLEEVLNGSTRLCLITGLAGVGKSALAVEVLHRVATNLPAIRRLFPDGIFLLQGTGRINHQGLLAVIRRVANAVTTAAHQGRQRLPAQFSPPAQGTPDLPLESAADVMDDARIALAGKQFLLALDQMEAQFPLQQLLDILQTTEGEAHPGRSVLLVTSTYIPQLAEPAYHLPLPLLTVPAARELFLSECKREVTKAEHNAVDRLCAAVGYLPLAIKMAATAARVGALPLDLLATYLTAYPLSSAFDSAGELRALFARQLAGIEKEAVERFLSLATLDTLSFGLPYAATLWQNCRTAQMETPPMAIPRVLHQHGTDPQHDHERMLHTAWTVGELERLVRYSLLDVDAQALEEHSTAPQEEQALRLQYRMHPLLQAYATARKQDLDPALIHRLERAALAYALEHIEQYQRDHTQILRERELLVAAMRHAWKTGAHSQLIALVAGIAPLFADLTDLATTERFLRWGLHSCHVTGNHRQAAQFLNLLGVLSKFADRGDEARGLFERSLQLTTANRGPVEQWNPWNPLGNLAYLAIEQGKYECAMQLAEQFLTHTLELEPSAAIVARAYLLRGGFAQQMGRLDRAEEDFHACLQQLDPSYGETATDERWLALEAQANLAQLHGEGRQALLYLQEAAQGTPLHRKVPLWMTELCVAHSAGFAQESQAITQCIAEQVPQEWRFFHRCVAQYRTPKHLGQKGA